MYRSCKRELLLDLEGLTDETATTESIEKFISLTLFQNTNILTNSIP